MATPLIEQEVPTIILGPGHVEQKHTTDEWVEIDQIIQTARIYALLSKF